jgi:hypothetical protein
MSNDPEYKKQWYLANREKILAQRKQYRLDHQDEIREADRNRYLAFPEKVRKKNRLARLRQQLAKPEKVRQQPRQYQINYAEKIFREAKAWRLAHPEHMAKCPLKVQYE